MSKEKKYYVVWERNKNVARVYNRKMSAIYDHIRFKVKQKVWFLDELTAEQVKKRLSGVKYTYIREGVDNV